MKRFLKLHYGQKGFTLIELLIVVAILGILAAVLVPNLATFLGTGTVAAANTEAANVETAALAYYADNNGNWPDDGDVLFTGNATYLSSLPKGDYTIGSGNYGRISSALPRNWSDINWDTAAHKWVKD